MPTDDDELRYWLFNMAAHGYSDDEVGQTFGISPNEAAAIRQRFADGQAPIKKLIDQLGKGSPVILPYPGGRHPRIGFLEGAVNPQRETKVSVFAPWKGGGYIVVDLPEAVWHQPGGKRELLYLAHTHVPTIWDRLGIQLPRLEWQRKDDGSLTLTREFPSKVKMVSTAKTVPGGVRFEFGIDNHSEVPLTGLNIQMCAMLKGLTGFEDQTNDNKVFSAPFAACKSRVGNRWVVFGFDHCHRAWGNAPCPCLHADPQVPDCAPGESHIVHGWLSFFEGESIQKELQRLEAIAFEPGRDAEQ